jgi:hypothetical protein
VERQMGRMALAGPGRAPDRPRAVLTEKEKREKVRLLIGCYFFSTCSQEIHRQCFCDPSQAPF